MSHYLVKLNDVVSMGVPELDVRFFDVAAEKLKGKVSVWRRKKLREQFLEAIQKGDFKYVPDEILPFNIETLRSLPGSARLEYQKTLDARRLEDTLNLCALENLKFKALLQRHGVEYSRALGGLGRPHIRSGVLVESHVSCALCDAIGVTLQNLHAFKMRTTQLKRRMEKKTSGAPVRVGCQYCSQQFLSKRTLHYHVASCHHSDVRCSVCGRLFRHCVAYKKYKQHR